MGGRKEGELRRGGLNPAIHSFVCKAGCDILAALSAGIPGAAKSTLRNYLSEGRVRLDGMPVAAFRAAVSEGALVEVLRENRDSIGGTSPGVLEPEGGRRIDRGVRVLWEDAFLIAVEKPEGLLSSPLEASKAKTALDIVSRYLERRNPGAKNRAALVHRLDRDTSGVMIFAKGPEAKKAMMENWASLVRERRYSALVEGEIKSEGGRIDAPLRQNRGTTMFVPSGEESRPEEGAHDLSALTEWRLLRLGSGYSLLDVSLETGRKNQIRAHLAHIGYPVAGDVKYGARTNPLGRLGLHARLISLLHPFSGERLSFESPCPLVFTSIFRESPHRFP